ncbi:hypothetical protein D7X48_10430 [bacterium D16-50]|nr:hypothetical protein D7X48_10430 [bacterium D16-50]
MAPAFPIFAARKAPCARGRAQGASGGSGEGGDSYISAGFRMEFVVRGRDLTTSTERANTGSY